MRKLLGMVLVSVLIAADSSVRQVTNWIVTDLKTVEGTRILYHIFKHLIIQQEGKHEKGFFPNYISEFFWTNIFSYKAGICNWHLYISSVLLIRWKVKLKKNRKINKCIQGSQLTIKSACQIHLPGWRKNLLRQTGKKTMWIKKCLPYKKSELPSK